MPNLIGLLPELINLIICKLDKVSLTMLYHVNKQFSKKYLFNVNKLKKNRDM